MSVFHRPVVSASASRYVLLMLMAFAVTVVGTRLYLEMTGYPQIGNETFHFAHALWGGLLLVIASLLLLVYVNRWINSLSAVLAGVGVGLFIDEVGKFITQQNDYFFPLAAPIIYVAILLTLLAWLLVRRQPSGSNLRADMYKVVSDLEEVLEADLSVSERQFMLARLKPITRQTERPDLAELANYMTAFLQSEAVTVVPDRATAGTRFLKGWQRFEERFFSRTRTRRFLVLLFVAHGVFTLIGLALLIGLVQSGEFTRFLLVESIVLDNVNVDSTTSLNWYLVMTGLEILTGVLIFAGALAFLVRRDTLAVTLGLMALIITLIFTNTLSFYFNQFSVMLNSIYSFVILLMLQRYRDRFLRTAAT